MTPNGKRYFASCLFCYASTAGLEDPEMAKINLEFREFCPRDKRDKLREQRFKRY